MAESRQQAAGSRARAARLDPETLVAAATGKVAAKAEAKVPAARDDSINDRDVGLDRDAGLQAFLQANEAIVAGMATLGAEMVAFGDRRLQQNLERSETLAECEDPEQAFHIQCSFFESAAQQYVDQTNHVMAIMTAMTREFWAPFQEQTRRTLHELNDKKAEE